MSDLPAGWTACTLGDIVERIETGKSVRCNERPPQGTEDGLVKISAVTWGEFDEQESKTLFDSSHLKPEEKIQLGDFLISRANTLELVGSCVMVKRISKNLYLSDKVLRLVLPDEAKPWLLVCLRSQAGREQIESLATGNQLSMRNISQQALREIHMPLPPLAEQTRIAAKLDELLAQVDTLKARIDGIPALLKRFRQSVLAAAVSGRLTEEWRRASCQIPEDQPFVYPSRKLGVLARFIDYRGKTPEKVESGIPLITAKNIRQGYLSREPQEFIRPEAYEGWMTRGIPQVGDVVITTEAPLGNVATIDIEERFALAQRAICLQFYEGFSSGFAAIALQSPLLQEELTRRSTGSTVKGIKASVLKEIELPDPAIEEQTEIVRRVEQLFAFADQLEARLKAAQAHIDRLTQSILAKAFRGELVPQDPNDEPASVLLERIKAQRAAAPKAKRGRRAATLS
ncbi:restriction endonuclease subunit S [Stutzerimonas stutzeri]|uniref:restriction endonuclease subunit S n=1 Tax=Stutzerimonas stutzeri TaxID=316 RepID=UPI00210F193C|nr:restriction endonuclease subunit S [Stutzerimonas stutzeri]MCQ4257945.1 restriction endonuclease subunit S [Stutzerimonas stutzeri]